jgi:hypothetical protein
MKTSRAKSNKKRCALGLERHKQRFEHRLYPVPSAQDHQRDMHRAASLRLDTMGLRRIRRYASRGRLHHRHDPNPHCLWQPLP